jgi:hypothetical protein
VPGAAAGVACAAAAVPWRMGRAKSGASEAALLEAMGGLSSPFRRRIVQRLHALSTYFPPCSPSLALLIQASTLRISMLKGQLAAITAMLDTITQDNAAVMALRQTRGIATLTASTVAAEIIDIRRFSSEDSPTCYAGLGRKEHSTGQSTRMVPSSLFNHRLKDAFMTAARNVVRFNPDSHLAGYCSNLIKTGMSPLEASMRVARALVRVLYRTLSSLVQDDTDTQTGERRQEAGRDITSGSTRSDEGHHSNMPLPAQRYSTAQQAHRESRGRSRSRTRAHGAEQRYPPIGALDRTKTVYH